MRCTGGPQGTPWIDGERANARAEGESMQTLMQIVLAFVAAALLLIVLVVVVAIQLIGMLAGTEEEVAEHLVSETESLRL
jgi:hypothetical protein